MKVANLLSRGEGRFDLTYEGLKFICCVDWFGSFAVLILPMRD